MDPTLFMVKLDIILLSAPHSVASVCNILEGREDGPSHPVVVHPGTNFGILKREQQGPENVISLLLKNKINPTN